MAKEKLFEPEEVEVAQEKYVYYLVNKNPQLNNTVEIRSNKTVPTEDYPPTVTIPNQSSVAWPGGKDWDGENRPRGLYIIRYYVGCSSLFADKQPKDKDILEQFLKNPGNEITFGKGRVEISAYDTMKKLFMDMASFNQDSPYRAAHVKVFYKAYNEFNEKEAEGDLLDQQFEAMGLAKKATEKQIRFHAKYLGIPTFNQDTGMDRPLKLIKVDYLKAASADSKKFISTFSDTSLKIKHWISEAIANGNINTTLQPNKAIWQNSKSEICDIPGSSKTDVIITHLFEFAQKKEGEEFLNQLRSLDK